MPWFPDAIVTASNPGGLGMNVYPVGSGPSGSITVTIVCGSLGDISIPISGSIAVSGTVHSIQSGSWIVSISGSTHVSGTVTASLDSRSLAGTLSNLEATRLKQRFDMASNTVNYIGYAALGTVDSSASWTIKRLTFTPGGNPTAAEWSSMTASWTNRTSAVYS